jgi:hypothetical protein
VAILVVYHLKKGKEEDAEDEISGSTGLTGGVDGWWILRQATGKGTVLVVNGRDIEEPRELAVEFDGLSATWLIKGEAEEVLMSEERQAIRQILLKAPDPQGPKDVADMIPGAKYRNIKFLMCQMHEDGQLEKDARGKYRVVSKVSDGEKSTNLFKSQNPSKQAGFEEKVSKVSEVSSPLSADLPPGESATLEELKQRRQGLTGHWGQVIPSKDTAQGEKSYVDPDDENTEII